MKFKKIMAIVLSVASVLTAMPAMAAETKTEPVKYENSIYHIGYDLPVDSYFLIQKDKTKPSFVGVYSNYGNPKSELIKYYKISKYTEINYNYPHIFESNELFSSRDTEAKTTENHGKPLYSKYFEFSDYIDLSDKIIKGDPYNYICFENCYAVSVKDGDKIKWDPNNDGYMPMSTYYRKETVYNLKSAKDKPVAEFECYKYNPKNGKTTLLERKFVLNPVYIDYADKHSVDVGIGTSINVKIPKDTNIICKRNVEVYDLNAKLLYTDQDIAKADKFDEQYNFKDISPQFMDFAKVRLEEMFDKNDKHNDNIKTDLFKAVTEAARTDADKRYAGYIRELAYMSEIDVFDKMYVTRAVNSAVSYKDLDYALRNMVYYNEMTKTYGIDDDVYINRQLLHI